MTDEENEKVIATPFFNVEDRDRTDDKLLLEEIAEVLYKTSYEHWSGLYPPNYGWAGQPEWKKEEWRVRAAPILSKVQEQYVRLEVIYVGNDHYQTTSKVKDDSYSGSNYWHCYIPSVITGKIGVEPERGDLFWLSLKKQEIEGERCPTLK